jgi:Major Facilitator Superfamily/Acetyltransferase (GNAT) domain
VYLGSVSVALREGGNVGYMLAPSARGHGFMTEAVRAVVRWAREVHSIESLQLWAHPDNLASQGVAERAGFARLGERRCDTPFRDGSTVGILFETSRLAGRRIRQLPRLLARGPRGAGGALVAPAALSLITTTFPEGTERTRAFGVYAAMSIAGGAIGLIGGGVLTTYASWRWVLFVNVPIGAVVALAASRVLAETPRRRGPVRPARRAHRHRRDHRTRLRPDQRRHQPHRRLPLG